MVYCHDQYHVNIHQLGNTDNGILLMFQYQAMLEDTSIWDLKYTFTKIRTGNWILQQAKHQKQDSQRMTTHFA